MCAMILTMILTMNYLHTHTEDLHVM
uniref:Uncharacterized protein n=1 Tax=Rhizophora mucronata TaxID=61149 RepID=A0A2P2MJ22_RHIMU